MKLKRHFYLMISCPSDVVNERKLLKECVEIINNERNDDVWVELQYWATDTSSDAGMLAQDSINEQLVKESDGLIAIFNARLGTPVHQYRCGTEEEIALMLAANKHVSLLFNTCPRIDLSKQSSIDQITKLQEFKVEQSQKAYYKEFNDDEGFMATAKTEIRLWLRKLLSSDNQKNTTENSNNSNENNTSEVLDNNKELISLPCEINIVENDEKDENNENDENDAGIIDCVVYIIDSANELSGEIDKMNRLAEDLTAKTNVFNDKCNVLGKQKNSTAATLALCKNFSGVVSKISEEMDAIMNNMFYKWDKINKYSVRYIDIHVVYNDKLILKDSISSLREIFSRILPQCDELVHIFSSVPYMQKDLNHSIDELTKIFVKYKKFINKVIFDCQKIEELFIKDLLPGEFEESE